MFLGPLIVEEGGKYVVAGVVSWGYGCGSEGYPGVYARVTSQLDWVLASVGDEQLICEVNENQDNCLK